LGRQSKKQTTKALQGRHTLAMGIAHRISPTKQKALKERNKLATEQIN